MLRKMKQRDHSTAEAGTRVYSLPSQAKQALPPGLCTKLPETYPSGWPLYQAALKLKYTRGPTWRTSNGCEERFFFSFSGNATARDNVCF